MVFFPYNSMFAGYAANKTIVTYSLKINGKILPVTSKMWWKKDFLETNASVYGRYIEEGKQTGLGNFIADKIKDPSTQKFFKERLTAGEIDPEEWTLFYTAFAGHAIQKGEEAELIKYELKFNSKMPDIIDSTSIFKFRQP